MILRRPSTRPDPSMGAPARGRGPVRLAPMRMRGRLELARTRFDPNLGGWWDDVTGAVSTAVHTAINTTEESIKIPLQTVSAVASGNVSQVPSLLRQAAGTIPLVSNILPGGPSGEGTGSTTSTLQLTPQQAVATAGLVPGTPQYLAALQGPQLAPGAPSSNLPLILGVGGGVLLLALLLRPRAPQS